METSGYTARLHSTPMHTSHGYEQVTGGTELQNSPSQQIQSTVVTIALEEPPVRDHIIWSLFNAMYMNVFCLGFIALVYSVKSRDRKLLKDMNGATGYSSMARKLNIATTAVFIFIGIIIAIAFIVSSTASYSYAYGYRYRNW
ncbi:unnamed protein product [Staurois parvus]|uniref:Interferon-induced transmembrane protein 1 n=1 Tax=Staurois parvus TaxID=386267 RepID=A0ABN9HJB9_9NEOB|nr:unnamed protein product [Staurois parvus]